MNSGLKCYNSDVLLVVIRCCQTSYHITTAEQWKADTNELYNTTIAVNQRPSTKHGLISNGVHIRWPDNKIWKPIFFLIKHKKSFTSKYDNLVFRIPHYLPAASWLYFKELVVKPLALIVIFHKSSQHYWPPSQKTLCLWELWHSIINTAQRSATTPTNTVRVLWLLNT